MLTPRNDPAVLARLADARRTSGCDSGAPWGSTQAKLVTGEATGVRGFGHIDGITAVMLLAPEAMHTWGRRMYERIAGDAEACACMVPMPPSSYHVTLHGMEWFMHNDECCTAERLYAVESFLQATFPKHNLRFTPDVDYSTRVASVAKLACVSEDEEKALRVAERACKTLPLGLPAECDDSNAAFDGIRPPLGAFQFWHLSFGYWKEGVPQDVKDRVHRRLMETFTEVLAGGAVECLRPMVCVYRSMACFEPLFVPATSPELTRGFRTMGGLNPIPIDVKSAAIPQHRFGAAPAAPGRLIFFTGPSGMGKSTAASAYIEQLLVAAAAAGSTAAFMYEGDAFFDGAEPYVAPTRDVIAGPSNTGTRFIPDVPQNIRGPAATLMKGILRYVGRGVDGDAAFGGGGGGEGENEPPTLAESAPFLHVLCDDVRAEYMRLGGTFAVAFAVYTKEARNVVRERLADLKPCFVVIDGSADLNVQRLRARAEATNMPLLEPIPNRTKGFEAAGPEEPDTLGITATADGPSPAAIAELVCQHFPVFSSSPCQD